MRKSKEKELEEYIKELKTKRKELIDTNNKFLKVERYNCYINNGKTIIREKLLKSEYVVIYP